MKYPQLVSMPSAVSDWLEEQLEARGIDAVVYTRYVLSLLYRDPVDIICPDQDLHITHSNKEVRRAGGGRKRFYRPSNFSRWGHADADRLKRSAAVECLKSASDQKCGIESLVDELCIKLKQVQREDEVDAEEPRTVKESKVVRVPKKISERDSARRYYAAFPALCRTPSSSATATSPKLVHFIPKWLGSPKRRISSASKKSQRAPGSLGDKLHATCKQEVEMKSRSVGKHRFNYFTRGINSTTPAAANHKKETKRPGISAHCDSAMNAKPKNYTQDELMYDDLTVLGDIRELLDSPASPTSTIPVDFMNMANMTESGSNKFLQCGTNIINSIWSTSDDLGSEFSNISVDHNLWSAAPSQFCGDEWGFKLDKFERWSDGGYDQESLVAKSLLKLNYHRGGSCFAEVQPRNRFAVHAGPDPITRALDTSAKSSASETAAKEDLLHSASSHFKPINEKVEVKTRRYVDGTTFVVNCNLDVVTFQRSKSGTMFLQESGCHKRYLEYIKDEEPTGLKLKFNVNQNDKGCQTVDSDLDESSSRYAYTIIKLDRCIDTVHIYFAIDDEVCAESELEQRPDSMMAELFGKEQKCEQCLNSHSSTNIWNGDICKTCLLASYTPENGAFKVTPMEERQQLREDIQEDGEQLLSDLSSLQKSYMEKDLPKIMEFDLEDVLSLGDDSHGKSHKEKHLPRIMEFDLEDVLSLGDGSQQSYMKKSLPKIMEFGVKDLWSLGDGNQQSYMKKSLPKIMEFNLEDVLPSDDGSKKSHREKHLPRIMEFDFEDIMSFGDGSQQSYMKKSLPKIMEFDMKDLLPSDDGSQKSHMGKDLPKIMEFDMGEVLSLDDGIPKSYMKKGLPKIVEFDMKDLLPSDDGSQKCYMEKDLPKFVEFDAEDLLSSDEDSEKSYMGKDLAKPMEFDMEKVLPLNHGIPKRYIKKGLPKVVEFDIKDLLPSDDGSQKAYIEKDLPKFVDFDAEDLLSSDDDSQKSYMGKDLPKIMEFNMEEVLTLDGGIPKSYMKKGLPKIAEFDMKDLLPSDDGSQKCYMEKDLPKFVEFDMEDILSSDDGSDNDQGNGYGITGGKQLLSDLSSPQKSRMEKDLPTTVEFDMDDLLSSDDGSDNDQGNGYGITGGGWRELRIKHAVGVPMHSASFSFATRLQQDCLMKMATIPTLRSVTL